MKLYWWRLFLCFLFGRCVRTDWPSFDSSKIQLLGLFPDASNISKSTTLSSHSRAMFKAAIILSHRYNITVGGEFIDWKAVQTTGDAIGAFRSSCLTLSTSDVVGIVGAAYSKESRMIALFGKEIGIPVISYASTDPELSDRNTYPAFYRTVPADNTAALVLVNLFHQYNWTSCIIIYQNDAYGSGGATAINDVFSRNNLVVADMIVFDITTLSIRGDLKSLLTGSSTRMIILWAISEYASILIENALSVGVVGPGFNWILSSGILLDSFRSTMVRSIKWHTDYLSQLSEVLLMHQLTKHY